MHKSLLLLLSATIFAAGCASPRLPEPPIACPPAPQLPPLRKLPQEVTGPSFLDRLDTILFQKPTAPTSSDFSLRPANGSTKRLETR